MKAIILSAGQGRRLLPLTEEQPKAAYTRSIYDVMEDALEVDWDALRKSPVTSLKIYLVAQCVGHTTFSTRSFPASGEGCHPHRPSLGACCRCLRERCYSAEPLIACGGELLLCSDCLWLPRSF